MKPIRSAIRNPLLASLLFGCLFWVADGFLEHYYFRDFIKFMIIEGPENLSESILFKISPHGLFVRISVMIASAVGGLLMWIYLIRLTASRKELKKFKTISDNSSSGTIILSVDGKILYINNAYAGMHGRSPEELIGKPFYSFFAEKQKPHIVALIQKLIDEGSFSAEKVLNVSKDGVEFPTIMNATTIRDGNQRPLFLSGTAIDLSEQELIEKEKKQLEQKLQQVQKMESIGNLAGGIAHDFNNILSSIIGFTELALDDVDKGSTIEDNLQEVYIGGMRAKELVRQILTFARQSNAELKPIRVDTIVKEVLKFIRPSIPTTIEIQANIYSDSLVMGNQIQVHQILMNLCTNAAHAMDNEGGILKLELNDVSIDSGKMANTIGINPGNYIEIKVSDTGVGISPAARELIFEPYFTTKGPGEGTGMGLAMVHGIVEIYGGKIMLDSRLGEGTVFAIYLPIIKKRQENRPYEPRDLPSGNERILFVDDDLAIAKMGGQTLEHLGYSVTTRTSSVEALELFRSKPTDFDLVITDTTMPNMTGDKLARELMKIRPNLPVILCTGYSKKISDDSAAAIGIKAFEYKPIVKADLAKTVRKVLDAGRSEA